MITREFSIPYPPSVNSLYRSVARGRGHVQVVKSTEGKRFYIRARKAIRSQLGETLKPTKERVGVTVFAFQPDKKQRDIDNLFKATLDAMNGLVYDDDHLIDDLRIIRAEVDRKNPRLEIIVKTLSNKGRLSGNEN